MKKLVRERKKILEIVLVSTLISSFLLAGVQLSAPIVKAYTTPGSGVVWNMDDLVANSGGAVTSGVPGVYYVHENIFINFGDILNMRDNEEVYFDAGLAIGFTVWGTFNSPGVNGILFTSGSGTPEPQDWSGIRVNGGIGSLSNTTIKYAETGIWSQGGGYATLTDCTLTDNYPRGVYLSTSSLIVNRSVILGSTPPASAGTDDGGDAVDMFGPIVAPLWINESTIVGGDALVGGYGGVGIYVQFPDQVIGIVGNTLIKGGKGGNTSVNDSFAGGGGDAITVIRVPNSDYPAGLTISHNLEIVGGDGGHSLGSVDSHAGVGGDGLYVDDNDYFGSVDISHNNLIAGGRAGDNYADSNVTFSWTMGGRGAYLARFGGNVSTVAFNTLRGGRSGDNSGKGNSSIWYGSGRGGDGLELNTVRGVLFEHNEILGGDGGVNFAAGEYIYGPGGGRGLYTWDDRDVLMRFTNITGGKGGGQYWGDPFNARSAGEGGQGAYFAYSNMTLLDSNLTGGDGGDNYAWFASAGSGGLGAYVTTELGPNITGGVIRGGPGGDNFNETANGAGYGGAAMRFNRASYMEIEGAEIIGGDGGDNYVGSGPSPRYGSSALNMYNGTHMYIHDNPIIAAGNGGIDYVDWNNASSGYTGVQLDVRSSDVVIANNTHMNHSGYGIRIECEDVEVYGNTIIGGENGISTWFADWINSTNNRLMGSTSYAISLYVTENLTSHDDTIIDAYRGVDLVWTNHTHFENTVIGSVHTGVRTENVDNAFFENCSLSGTTYTWDLNQAASVVALNTTFNSTAVTPMSVHVSSTLTILNYLDVKVLDSTIAPIPNADIQLTDNGLPTYATSGYGGSDPQTSVDGSVNWIVVTDRIYEGSNVPTENITVATVSSPGKSFIANNRDVDMSYSHEEVFYEYGAEVFPPEISMVRVNGATSIDVMAGTPVRLNATLDDSNTGGSNIANANYTVGPKNWPGTPMTAADGSFSGVLEEAEANVDTSLWAQGSYEIWTYGCDSSGWCNETGDFATINIVGDIWPPEIYSVRVDGQPSQTVAAGTTVTLTAVIDDAGNGGSIIAGANYTIGSMNWSSSKLMSPSDIFDTSNESVQAIVDTAGWACGVHDLYVYAWDDAGNYNTTSTAYATIIINVCDFQPPEITNILINSQAGASYGISSLPPTVLLTATIDDTNTGNSNISGANYTTSPGAWPGTPMTASDGAFGETVEDVEATITTPSAPGLYLYYIYAWDDVSPSNYNNSAPSVWLEILDDLPPETQNVLVNDQPSLTVDQGDIVYINATVSDVFTGGATITYANATLLPVVGPPWPMNAVDATFDEVTEDVQIVIDTSGLPTGTYTVCVYATDAWFNENSTCSMFATLEVISLDTMAPTASNTAVNGQITDAVTQGAIVHLTAFADDSTTGNSNIFSANYTDGAGNWASSTPMTAQDGNFDSSQEDVEAYIDTATWSLGSHEICVHAEDVANNANISCSDPATLEILAPDTAPPVVSQVLVNGSAAFDISPGGIVRLTAFVDDTTTGDSIISSANYTIEAANWSSSTSMIAQDGNFDSSQEFVEADVDTSGWSLGTYSLCFYAMDAEGNGYVAPPQCAVVNIVEKVNPKATGSPKGSDVPLSTDITILFTQPMDMFETNQSFMITDFQNIWDRLDGAIHWTDNGKNMTYHPSFGLSYDTTYLVVLNGSVAKDVQGNLLDGNGDGIGGDDYYFWFKIEAYVPVDTDPPEVSDTNPGDDTTNVPVTTRVITVDFDEEMDKGSVDVSIDPLTQYEKSWSENTLYIIIDTELKANRDYTVTISGATDANDVALDVDGDGNPDPGGDFSFTFRTGSKAQIPAGFDLGWIVVIILAVVVVILLVLLFKRPKARVFQPIEEKEAVAVVEEKEEEEKLEDL